MPMMPRLSLLPGVLLLVAAPVVLAESPMPDPVAPAVVGRPLDKIVPARGTPTQAARTPEPAPRPSAVRKVVGPTTSSPPAQDANAARHVPKQALDDRADPGMRLSEVGVGTHFARKPLGAGAYFGDRHRAAVRKYYTEHPAPAASAGWKIGEPMPRGAAVAEVPRGLLASLPKLPPGHRYVQLGGEVVLVASGSRMVVDGISRTR